MHPHVDLIQKFYTAFQNRDSKQMAICYHPNARFSDPVFPQLYGAELIGGMWRMLCESGTDLEITFKDVRADDEIGSAHWEATYTFAGGHQVHNIIQAQFRFEKGLIMEHHDQFNFWRWSRMALGVPGYFLGWTNFLQKQVQRQARRRLENFLHAG